jgi:hypothetical protein
LLVSRNETVPVGGELCAPPTVAAKVKFPGLPLDAIDMVVGEGPVTISAVAAETLPAFVFVPTNTAL